MSIRDLILRDFWWKLASFLLALVIWGVVKEEIRQGPRIGVDSEIQAVYGEFRKIPLTLLRPAVDGRAMKVTPAEVDVVVSGDRLQIRRLEAREIEVFIRLADARKPDGLPRKISWTAPSGITVVRVIPSEAVVTLADTDPVSKK